MKQSLEFIPTLKDISSDAVIQSHKVMLKGGYVHQVAAGIYTYLPLGLRVIKNIEKIIREELNNIGCSELLMPTLHPKSLWDETNRWDAYGDNLMRLTDRHNREFALGPTHEEVITDLIRTYVKSYKKLPLALYQIQTKFRDEFRPRFGLMRGREFVMKDLYTFHESKQELDEWYDKVAQCYKNIFTRCGLKFVQVEADNGDIGGDSSHEFMALCDIGEDTITYCDKCGYSANVESSNLKANDPCPKCDAKILEAKGVELGHIFQLGTKYSQQMNANINNKDGSLSPIIMGCYGIGVSRIVMAVLEQCSIENKVIWPEQLKPYDIHLIIGNMKDEDVVKKAYEIENMFTKKGLSVLLDDRSERMGSKLKDADLIGIDKRYVFGKDFKDGFVEYTYKNEAPELVRLENL